MSAIRVSAKAAIPLLLLCVIGACRGPAGSAATPTEPSSEAVLGRVGPATVLVYSRFTAEVTVPRQVMSPAQQQAMGNALAARANAGQLDLGNQQAVAIASLEEETDHISTYLSPDPDPAGLARMTEQVTTIGSGFIVSRDGAAVTSAHNVAPGDTLVKTAMVRQVATRIAAAPSVTQPGQPAFVVPAELEQRFRDAQLRWTLEYARASDITTTLLAFTGTSVAGELHAAQAIPARLVTAGAAPPGEDIAVIQLESHKRWPTATLASEKTLRVGDRLSVVGYPIGASLNPTLTQDQSFGLRLTQGVMSGQQPMQGGWNAIQTDAATTHGNSGGPILNSNGQVVGVLSFGSIDPDTGQEVQGLSVGVPESLVKKLLANARVTPS